MGRGNLTVCYAKIIAGLTPKIFLMENVDMLVKSAKYAEAVKIFKKAGYGITVKLFDASFCGVFQKRKRNIVIGILGGKDEEMMDALEKNLSKKPMTVRDYFGKKTPVKYIIAILGITVDAACSASTSRARPSGESIVRYPKATSLIQMMRLPFRA